jgi:formate dehydrogenase accessory protein FdhE
VKKPGAADISSAAIDFERRAARAEALVAGHPHSEEPLRFAAGLYREQGGAASRIDEARRSTPLTGRLDHDAETVLSTASAILRYAAAAGPPLLAETARARQADLPSTANTRLLVFWSEDRSSAEDYLSRAILRPYVETLRGAGVAPDRIHRRGRCPFCGGPPWVGARRDGSLMEGARRMLSCALCGNEWPFERILCPACLEENPERLPSFSSPAHPLVRIEACETCHRYVKSIDLSEDARPIPEVDDLVSLSLDLWAVEQGFRRIEPGLAGL